MGIPSVFLSHNTADKPFARRLCRDLQSMDICCWLDEAEIKVGDSLLKKIGEGIEGCEFLAVVLSPRSVKSQWVKRELEVAVNGQIRERNITVLPILLTPCDIPPFLKGTAYADFRTNYKRGLSSLLNALIPKSKFSNSSAYADRAGGSAVVSFKDDWEKPLLRRSVTLATSIADIRRMNPQKVEGLWAELTFDETPLIDHVDLFSYKKERQIRLSFHGDLNRLAVNEPGEKKWQESIRIAEEEIWECDAEIRSIFESAEVAVNWGGPDGGHVRAETEVLYYIDHSIGYLIADRSWKGRGGLDHKTIEDLELAATQFSGLLQRIIDRTLSRLKTRR